MARAGDHGRTRGRIVAALATACALAAGCETLPPVPEARFPLEGTNAVLAFDDPPSDAAIRAECAAVTEQVLRVQAELGWRCREAIVVAEQPRGPSDHRIWGDDGRVDAMGVHFTDRNRVYLRRMPIVLFHLRHELAHAFVADRGWAGRVPLWANEGFARQLEAPLGRDPLHVLAAARSLVTEGAVIETLMTDVRREECCDQFIAWIAFAGLQRSWELGPEATLRRIVERTPTEDELRRAVELQSDWLVGYELDRDLEERLAAGTFETWELRGLALSQRGRRPSKELVICSCIGVAADTDPRLAPFVARNLYLLTYFALLEAKDPQVTLEAVLTGIAGTPVESEFSALWRDAVAARGAAGTSGAMPPLRGVGQQGVDLHRRGALATLPIDDLRGVLEELEGSTDREELLLALAAILDLYPTHAARSGEWILHPVQLEGAALRDMYATAVRIVERLAPLEPEEFVRVTGDRRAASNRRPPLYFTLLNAVPWAEQPW